MALLGATIPEQSRPGSNGNEGVLRIPQSPSITGPSPSDSLVSYPGHSLGVSHLQSVYSTGWNDEIVVLKKTTLQLYFKTFIEKSSQVTWLCSSADIYSM